jgi:RNA polymerase sigma-70 factor (ECF subfamily)
MTGTIENEEQLGRIARILGGETQLFHELIRPYERSVFAMTFSLLRNEADAEDAAQEAFLKAFRNLSTFRGDSKFGTWLISIALNEARSRLRRRAAAPMESLDDEGEDTRPVSPALLRDWKEIPSEALERSEVRMMLQEAIARLPESYREVLLLRDVEEFSTLEVAEMLKISVGSAKVRLHRARMMMQKTLAPQLKQQVGSTRRWLPWF